MLAQLDINTRGVGRIRDSHANIMEFTITKEKICDTYIICRPEAHFVGRQPSWVTGNCPAGLVEMIFGQRLLVETILTFDFVLHRSLRTYLHRSYSRHPSFSSSVVTMKLETSRKCSRFIGEAAVAQGYQVFGFQLPNCGAASVEK